MTSPMTPLQTLANPDAPWLGLQPYTEASKDYFFGRTQEIEELFFRVTHQPLTILYSQSGNGKSSLLHAGLMPRLRFEGYRPYTLRLQFSRTQEDGIERREHISLSGQVKRALALALEENGLPGLKPTTRADHHRVLWEYYHDLEVRPDNLAVSPPVIILDQFEELFTLGLLACPPEQIKTFFQELSDLIENRLPQTIREALFGAASPDQTIAKPADQYDLGPAPVHFVLAMREDYLFHLDSWKNGFPSLMVNRMRLLRLNGKQALEAVIKPGRLEGRNLVSDEVGQEIVRLIAAVPSETPLETIENIPPMLNLFCFSLNEARRHANPPAEQITSALLKERKESIIPEFYETIFREMPQQEAIREFVEDALILESGYRLPLPWEEACVQLANRGIVQPEAVLQQLIHSRLLTALDREGRPWIEITHDLLKDVALKSKTARAERWAKQRQKEAESAANLARLKSRYSGLFALCFLILGVVAYGFYLRAESESEAAQTAKKNLEVANNELDEKNTALKAKQEELAKYTDVLEGSRIELSASLIERNETFLALSNLLEMPASLRAWEYGYLMRQITGSDLTLQRHTDWIKCTQWSPDGTKIATAGHDQIVVVWDVATGNVLQTYRGHANSVTCLSWSPDSTKIVSGGWDLTLCIWDVATGQTLREWKAHEQPITSVAWSPKGARLVSGGEDNAVRVWDAESGKKIQEHRKHTRSVTCVCWSPDGTKVASSGVDQDIYLADLPRETVVYFNDPEDPKRPESASHSGYISCIDWSPDGQSLVTGSPDSTLLVWDVRTRVSKTVLKGHRAAVWSVRFSPDGQRIASGSWDRTARIWNWQDNTSQELKGHTAHVWSVAWNPTGNRLCTAGEDNALKVWSLKAKQQSISQAQWNPTQQSLAVINTNLWQQNMPELETFDRLQPHGTRTVRLTPDFLQLQYAATQRRLLSIPLQRHCESFAWSPNGALLATLCLEVHILPEQTKRLTSIVQVWEAKTGQELFAVTKTHHGEKRPGLKPTDEQIQSLAWAWDNRSLALGYTSGVVERWDIQTRQLVLTKKPHKEPVFHIAWSAQGFRFYTCDSQRLLIYNDILNRVIAEYSVTEGVIESAAWNPTGQQIALLVAVPQPSRPQFSLKKMQVYDLATKSVVAALEADIRTTMPIPFAWNPEGTHLALGGPSPILWELATQERKPLLGHFNAVRAVAFSPDRKRLVTAGDDLCVWNAATGQRLLQLKINAEEVDSLHWSPDSQQIVALARGQLLWWDGRADQQTQYLIGHSDLVRSLRWDQRGQELLTCGRDGNAIIWDTATGKQRLKFDKGNSAGSVGRRSGREGIVVAEWSPDAQRVVSSSVTDTLYVWHASFGLEWAKFTEHQSEVVCAAWSPDVSLIISGDRGGGEEKKAVPSQLYIWNANTGERVHNLQGNPAIPWYVAWSPDGQFVFAKCSDRTIRCWNAKTGAPADVGNHKPQWPFHPGLSPNGERLAQMERQLIRVVPLQGSERDKQYAQRLAEPDRTWLLQQLRDAVWYDHDAAIVFYAPLVESDPMWKALDDWLTWSIRSSIGASYLRTQQHAKAKPRLTTAYEELKKRRATIPEQRRLTTLLWSLYPLLRLTNDTRDFAEFKKWQTERAALFAEEYANLKKAVAMRPAAEQFAAYIAQIDELIDLASFHYGHDAVKAIALATADEKAQFFADKLKYLEVQYERAKKNPDQLPADKAREFLLDVLAELIKHAKATNAPKDVEKWEAERKKLDPKE